MSGTLTPATDDDDLVPNVQAARILADLQQAAVQQTAVNNDVQQRLQFIEREQDTDDARLTTLEARRTAAPPADGGVTHYTFYPKPEAAWAAFVGVVTTLVAAGMFDRPVSDWRMWLLGAAAALARALPAAGFSATNRAPTPTPTAPTTPTAEAGLQRRS